MSDVHIEAATFFDLYARGEVSAPEINDFVEVWHSSGDEEQRSLSDYLGMTEDESSVWLMDTGSPPIILTARRLAARLLTLVADYLVELRAAGDPREATSI